MTDRQNYYSLIDFIEFDESKVRSGEHSVLVWSRMTGYYFTQYGYIIDRSNYTIVAMEA